MEMSNLYILGLKAKAGDEISLIKIIDKKRKFIKYMSYGDEDREQYIIEKLIKGIKNYNFQKFGLKIKVQLVVYIVKGKVQIILDALYQVQTGQALVYTWNYICKEGKILKIIIIAFIGLLAVIDLVAIFGPDVRKFFIKKAEQKKRKKKQKAFAEKMKSLEIK